ncbi:hypothetical protein HYH03_014146 [Edaphochlamys debaryana]|uniref:Uncharacterized protein n=1 Tax=Edaphochlamys debaryana TaxID=47281 RepID=A0A836BTT0_9CHLO|nr:hypothetical protein HYH03_014146 [Edaphochlamys debaryana]|eukprot:KAG2487164.1 hypothetical protein HYH03_014146 [Edaphochlamys debaryana]
MSQPQESQPKPPVPQKKSSKGLLGVIDAVASTIESGVGVAFDMTGRAVNKISDVTVSAGKATIGVAGKTVDKTVEHVVKGK